MNSKRISRRGLFGIGFMLAIQIGSGVRPLQATGLPQEPERPAAVVSGVRANLVEGAMVYQRDEGKFPLEAGLLLKESDWVTSESGSRAELLLQPGNYLRVNEETQFQLLGRQYDQLRFELHKGTVSFELLGHEYDRSGSFFDRLGNGYDLIRITTPRSEVLLMQPGIFRLNVATDGRTEIRVRKGEAIINGQLVKAKQTAVEERGAITIGEKGVRIDDAFDSWCRERSGRLIQANRSLQKDVPWVKAHKAGTDASIDLPRQDDQGSNPYIVSARPGKVTFVESGVEFCRAQQDWAKLTDDTELKAGDALRTKTHSHVELTMLLDIYLRLDGSSEILLEQLSNELISLKVLGGSAILDVATLDHKQSPPQLIFGGTSNKAVVVEEGNYRINARLSGDEIIVREGKVSLGDRSVGSCRQIVGQKVTECHQRRNDNFDFWSQHRGEGRFQDGRTMATWLSRIRRSRLKLSGFWYQPEGLGYYTFVPFFSTNFYSPYGGSYSTVLSPRQQPMFRIEPNTRGRVRFPRPTSVPIDP
jgi:hypothetical protein